MSTSDHPLKRLLGTPTALLLGMGVAIGSGIFRTPGEVAGTLQIPWLILLAWLAGGVVVGLQGLVTAELATRFPRDGGEYVYLKRAYGEFTAFFFGWAYTVFIIGGGAATIALAFGDFARELLNRPQPWSGFLAAGAIALVTAVNSIGLRTGAHVQNLMTAAKILALLAVAAVGLILGEGMDHGPVARFGGESSGLALGLTAILPVLWTYNGTTDAVKLAEEIKDVRRALPRAIIGSTLSLIVLYVLVNYALLRVLPASEMADSASVPGEAMFRLLGPMGRTIVLLIAMLVCLGSLSSTVLATIRVTFALARDGLTFRFMGRMSRAQSPVPAMLIVALISMVIVLNRDFYKALEIYYLASTVLFGLTYASLIVFRFRGQSESSDYFRCPYGMVAASIVIVVQVALAVNIVHHNPRDALYTLGMLLMVGVTYFIWKLVPAHRSRRENGRP